MCFVSPDVTFYGNEHSLSLRSCLIINTSFYPRSAFYPQSTVCNLQSMFCADQNGND